MWRSQYFYKGPKSPAIQWHQASTFMVEDYQDPGIFPPDRSEIFQLTVWVAIDDATPERGCLRFARGTHDRIRKIRFGGEEGFYKAAYTFDFDEKVEDCVELPVTAGQFIIFTERCIHGSGPNTTDHHRLAFNMRVIPTHVPAYTNKKYYRSVYNGGKYNLDKWGMCPAAWRGSHAAQPGDSAGRPRNGRVHAGDSARRTVADAGSQEGGRVARSRVSPRRDCEFRRNSPTLTQSRRRAVAGFLHL